VDVPPANEPMEELPREDEEKQVVGVAAAAVPYRKEI
jgi:hypothetical protein